jgi:hypothetical protein
MTPPRMSEGVRLAKVASLVSQGWVHTCDHTCHHSALNYLPRAEYYRGNSEARLAERRGKVQATRQRPWEA